MKVEYERGYYTQLNILFRKKCSCFFQEETKFFDNEWTRDFESHCTSLIRLFLVHA